MAKDNGDLLLKAGLIVGAYFVIVRPLMNLFGADPADTDKVQKELDKGTNSSFNPYWSVLVDSYNDLPMKDKDGKPFDFVKYFQTVNWLLETQDGAVGPVLTLTPNSYEDRMARFAQELKDDFEYWNWTPHVDDVIGRLMQLQTKKDFAWLSAYFSFNWNIDFFHWLHYGNGILAALPNGLTTKQVADLLRHIDTLPDE
jgi:hypothetical protein